MEGIGIAGPVVHAFRADLADLGPSDIYAAYAGWATEHEEIREQSAESIDDRERAEWIDRRGALVGMDYKDPQLVKVGQFFGQRHYIARSRHRDQPGILVDDGRKVEWFSSTGAARSVGAEEAYYIVKGRKLLRGSLE